MPTRHRGLSEEGKWRRWDVRREVEERKWDVRRREVEERRGGVIRQEVEERRGDIISVQAEEGRKFGFNAQSAMMVGSG